MKTDLQENVYDAPGFSRVHFQLPEKTALEGTKMWKECSGKSIIQGNACLFRSGRAGEIL